MSLKHILRALGRKLTPPGNREPLETSYRLHTSDGTQHGPTEAGAAMKAHSGGTGH